MVILEIQKPLGLISQFIFFVTLNEQSIEVFVIKSRMSDRTVSMVGRTAFLVCIVACPAHSERLPAKVYTTADGLAHNSIHRIICDSHGFLWFCTAEGLSRFDGYTFRNYGRKEGLPDPNIYDMLETRSGEYWVATGAGVCRFRDRQSDHSAEGSLQVYDLPAAAGREVHALAEGHDGTLWVGTTQGLSRLLRRPSASKFQFVDLQIPIGSTVPVTALLEDEFGSLWIGTATDLYRRWDNGRLERYPGRALVEAGHYWINNLREDGAGRIWASTSRGLLTFKPTLDACSNEHLFTHAPGVRMEFFFDALPLAEQTVWAVLLDGISRLSADAFLRKAYLEPVTSTFGLENFPLEAMALDRDHNIWIGSDGGGVSRISQNGFVTFSEADGLGSHDIISVFENARRQLFAVSRSRNGLFLNRFDEGRFQAIRINVPSDLVSTSWHGRYQVIVNTSGHEWWVATHKGLARFTDIKDPAELARARPRFYRTDENIFRLFEDRSGNVWVSNQHFPNNMLTVWNGRTSAFDRFPASSGGPGLANDRIQAYLEDRAGALWMGLEHGGLWRRSGNLFQQYGMAEGAPGRSINWLYNDSLGRVWIGSSVGGVSRVDEPERQRPHFMSYTTREGLSSDEVQCITEDLVGRIYLCTARGVDQLEPANGHIKHYTTADGLAGGELQTVFRDHMGELWFGTQLGLSRLIPRQDRSTGGVPVMLSGIRIENNDLALSQGGETKIFLPDLYPGNDRLQFEFIGLTFEPGEVLQYQYKIEGADKTWGASTPQRSVIYAHLHPGSYRFLVRAVTSDGLVSPQPASVDFRILAPMWLRWWFDLAMLGSIGVGAYWAWRYQARQLAAVKRVRTRIATDLHDDIGSGLSQIAILSEVVRRESSSRSEGTLDQIANVSRQLVDSMSDIVWATDPNRDRLGDLAQRMRQFAGEMLGGSEIDFQLLVDDIEVRRKLSVNMRRQIYLVFKECVTNVVHHSESTEARVKLNSNASSLILEIGDNGKGFDVSQRCRGYGVASMSERISRLGGSIEWTSGPGGTTVKICVPLHA